MYDLITTDPAYAEAYRQHECDRRESIASDPEETLLAADAFRIAEQAIDESFAKTNPTKAERMKHILRLCVIEDCTLEEVGTEFEITRERVRQILSQARSIVRRYMKRMDSQEASA